MPKRTLAWQNQKSYLLQIRNLIEYIESQPANADVMCEYIATKTLKDFGCSILNVARLDTEGIIRPVGSFGETQTSLKPWIEINIESELPASDAMRTDDLVWFSHYHDMWNIYPGLAQFDKRDNIETFIAMPLDVEGVPKIVVVAMFENVVEQDPEKLMFIWTVGALVSLGLSQMWRLHPLEVERADYYFTLRQKEVLQLIADGYSNAQIANRLGFSASTIRHETMKIYRALNADGRKDAIAIALKGNLLD